MANVADSDVEETSARKVAESSAATPSASGAEGPVPPPTKKARIAKSIATDTLAGLVCSYHKYFAEYSTTKTKVVQRIPAKVWKKVYVDYLSDTKRACTDAGIQFDEEILPAERSLQDSLRAALDPDTRVSNPSGAEKVVPQNDDVLQRLKQSDAHARRRFMLRHREGTIAGSITPSAVPAKGVSLGSIGHASGASSKETSEVGGQEENTSLMPNGSSPDAQRVAQSAAVQPPPAPRDTAAFIKIADAVHRLVDSATATGASMRSIAKTFETWERSRSQSEKVQIRRARLEELKWLYDNGVIPREVFLAKVSALTDHVLSTSGDE